MSVLIVACVGLATSGCAYTASEFAAPAAKAVVLTEPVAGSDAVAQTPTALVEERQAAASPQTRPIVATDASGFPNINAVPKAPTGKLLTPEEKAKVIAELEALAKSQGGPTAKARKEATAECEAAAKTLDPELKLKREREGLKC